MIRSPAAPGNDTLEGGEGLNSVYGGEANDHLYGSGNLYGGAGIDYLYGGEYSDSLYGGHGDDFLPGGEEQHKTSSWPRPTGFSSAVASTATSSALPVIQQPRSCLRLKRLVPMSSCSAGTGDPRRT
jgi:Ca2+-binding RTX toxin-like protein